MRVVTAAFAIAIALIVLLGYFLPIPLLMEFRTVLTEWAVVIGAFAVLVGIFNLVIVQLEKIRQRQKGSLYGIILVLSLIGTFIFGVVFGVDHPWMQLAVDAVIVPAEAALMAILVVTLVYASIRLLRQRRDAATVVFLTVVVLTLAALMPTPIGQIPGGQLIADFIGMFAHGGARGLLIGIALGTILTGLRVVFGIDRPYGGN
ncbi:MAG: hypothetical protein IT314_15010 [Anaerolineales bacterium]|nr:hypothetical protein [Anaerolineales bacterium]